MVEQQFVADFVLQERQELKGLPARPKAVADVVFEQPQGQELKGLVLWPMCFTVADAEFRTESRLPDCTLGTLGQ